MRPQVFTVTAFAHLLLLPSAASQSPPVPCTPLSNYIEPNSQDNLDIFLGGGAVADNVPVFFSIPRMQISATNPQVKLCIEDLTIPTSVGESVCDGFNKCWLIVGQHVGENLNHEDTQHCKSSDPVTGTAKCYGCLCGGTAFSNSSASPYLGSLIDSCGPSYEKKWGISCPDVNNGRGIPPYDGTASSYSNTSIVQINLCPDSFNSCSVCRGGGYHPQFRVGLQWLSTSEQCFIEPSFTSGGISMSTGLNVMGMVVISTVFLLASLYSKHAGY